MTFMKLTTGKILGCFAFEIITIPHYANISENENSAQEINESRFSKMLTELSRYCMPGKAVFEILWISQAVESNVQKSQIHIYFVVRMIAKSERELYQRCEPIQKNISTQLQAGGFQINKIDIKELQQSIKLPSTDTYVNAIVKSEQCTIHAQSMIPYYYVQPMIKESVSDFVMLSRIMTELPGSAVSFQLIPDSYSTQEMAAITEMYSVLNQIYAGSPIAQNDIYQDSMAQAAKEAYGYIYNNMQQPLYRYNILTFGDKNQCAILSAQLVTLLKERTINSYTTVNLNAEKICMQNMFLYYPWNVNKRLIQKYRNTQLWSMLQSIPLIQCLYRIPYMISAKEATNFFGIPIANKNIVGIKSKEVVQRVQDIDGRAVDENNIKFGIFIDNEDSGIEIGCPAKSLTKHMLIVGMPGTGKTTFSVNLLLQMHRNNIPFLAIEPTKTEYRAMIDAIPNLQIFTPGNNGVSPFVINPFIPPRGITVEQYIPSLASAFKAAFSMPSPLDGYFQEAIQETYVKYGWKDYSTAQDVDVTWFGLHEFILMFKKIISEQQYSADVKGNLQSGGVLRLRNLIEQNANIYDTTKTVPLEDLLSKPTVLELNAIDNEEQKSVLMALLLINICVYTKHHNIGDGELKNLILIDEAHVLFNAKEDSTDSQGGDSTVKSLNNMLKEVRSYGTSIVIADQSPTAVGKKVVESTDVKVAFRMVEISDRKTISETTNMDNLLEGQIPKLEVGQAFVSYEHLKDPVLVQTIDIREKENIRLSVTNEEVCQRMDYWNTHGEYLIPFNECQYSKWCKACSIKLRSDASFYAARFIQDYGAKITDIKSLYAYLKAVDKWMERQCHDNVEKVKRNNCVKIRILRRILQKKDFSLTSAEYVNILNKVLNVEIVEE